MWGLKEFNLFLIPINNNDKISIISSNVLGCLNGISFIIGSYKDNSFSYLDNLLIHRYWQLVS